VGGICGDKKKAKKDAEKAAKLEAQGERFYVCGKCGRTSHKESHLCKPKKG
jgi:intracellular sulfur oxidation DsrE/DsrF family protein